MARPTLSLQAAIGPGAAATDVFIIGSSLIGGTDVLGGLEIVGQGSLEEIGDRCISLSIRSGRQIQMERYRASQFGAVLDNSDGALDPSWTAGPYTDSGVSRVRSMAGIYLIANYLGVDYEMWAGFADAWKPGYHYPEGGVVQLTATDAFKIFAGIDTVEQSPIGAGDTTGDRINRILDLADWSVSLRDIDDGNATHQETTLDGSLLGQMELAADSERGELYMGPGGLVTHRGRQARYTNPRSLIVQWDIGDGSTQLNPADFDVTVDDDIIYNDINVSRVGGTTISRQKPGLAAYEVKSYNRSDLTLEDDWQVGDYADAVLLHNQNKGEPRVKSIILEPDGDDSLWPLVLGARFGDRISFAATHPYTGVTFTGDYFIEGRDHDITAIESGGKWRTTIYVDDASTFPTNPFMIGSSLLGGTDVLV